MVVNKKWHLKMLTKLKPVKCFLPKFKFILGEMCKSVLL